MKSAGFVYLPIKYVDSDLDFRLLNPLNEAVASQWGYHQPPQPDSIDQNDHEITGFDKALFDEPACGNRAISFVYDSAAVTRVTMATTTANVQIDSLLVATEVSDARNQRLTAWAECMSSRGYTVASPQAALLAFARSAEVTDDERDARMADLACDRSTKLTESLSLAQAAAVRLWEDSHAQDVAQIENLIGEAQREIGRLNDILATSGAKALLELDLNRSTEESTPPTTAPG